MELNLDQEQALKVAIDRYKHREPYTYISGQAGTGKSTLIRFIISALRLNAITDVCYATYTGKASLVLKEKGCPNVCTLHRLLYKAVQREDGTFLFVKKPKLEKYYKLIVIDEISMVNEEMWNLLLSHKVHVIALGDPAQLPPISGVNEKLGKPHAFLTQVMRQDQDSEIIQLSMLVREGKPLPLMKGNQVQVIKQSDFVPGMYEWADMVICATNARRRQLNNEIRKLKFGFDSPMPIKGDKLICLHNEWDVATKNEDVLVNGLIGFIEDIKYKNMPEIYKKYAPKQMFIDFKPDYYGEQNPTKFNTFYGLKADAKIFFSGEPMVTKENFKYIPKSIQPYQFDYAYAISCWKAQGDEFDKVLLFEEGFPFGDAHGQQLQTGITRAKSKLIIVKK